jgi:hypothetical protein
MTDEAPAYTFIGWNFLSHGSVKHSADEYVRGNVHTNTIEGYFSILSAASTAFTSMSPRRT